MTEAQKNRSEQQLAVLSKAREKAQQVRKENAELRKKEREIEKAEKDSAKEQRKKNVTEKYDKLKNPPKQQEA